MYYYCVTLLLFYFLANLHEMVEKYIKDEMLQDIVYFKKTNIREGLIRARLFGANLATGQVIKCLKLFMFKF